MIYRLVILLQLLMAIRFMYLHHIIIPPKKNYIIIIKIEI